MSDTLLVVPVRGGSRGIPRKAVRQLNGRSPLQYTLTTAQGLGDIVVVTDDAEIRAQAEACGVRVLGEPQLPTAPGVHTWEPVVYRAVLEAEQGRRPYAFVGVLQCTSPFLRRTTIQRCLDALMGHPVALTVRDDRHARIGTPRKPREQMPPCWKVTGGCTAIRRDLLVDGSWPVEQGLPVVVDGAEGVDLDTPEDWAIAEMYAGATERELLLARVLVPDQPHGPAVVLSAWDEQEAEQRTRFQHAIGDAISLHGENTRDEAERAVTLRSGNDITIVTSAYHQPRAFLTFLKVLYDHGLERTVRLWNIPAPSRMDRLAEEWHKITEYQAKGDTASVEQGLLFLDWRDACAT
jgi:CMP-N-acetylneuraminic acid synthetase